MKTLSLTQNKFGTSKTMNSSLMELPYLKHFNESEIATKANSFIKGEKSIFWFLKLAALVGTGYLFWQYVLPPIFQAIGQMLAVVATGAICVAAVMLAPVFVKWMRSLSRKLAKALITNDPFLELENQRKKMIENVQLFRMSKGKILSLKSDMEIEADKSEKDATALQNKILTLQGKAEKLKADMDAMVKKNGVQAKGEDIYVNANAELLKVVSESHRVSHKLTQDKDFVQKYGTRAAIMKKFSQKLVMVETSMDIKVADFDATVEMLKKDYDFAKKARSATDAAKNAMLFTKSWELEYALDVVTSTIASDIAITAGNLKDIDSLTSQYSLDSDELYTNLNILADNIRVGKDEIPTAKQYSNPEYQLTQSDKIKSAGFQDLM